MWIHRPRWKKTSYGGYGSARGHLAHASAEQAPRDATAVVSPASATVALGCAPALHALHGCRFVPIGTRRALDPRRATQREQIRRMSTRPPRAARRLATLARAVAALTVASAALLGGARDARAQP